jgi:hypothetical protein
MTYKNTKHLNQGYPTFSSFGPNNVSSLDPRAKKILQALFLKQLSPFLLSLTMAHFLRNYIYSTTVLLKYKYY